MVVAEPPSVAPVRIGPEGLPKLTLGWQVLGWTATYLLQPDGPRAGEPWKFTNEQARFVLWWYAIDQSGEFRYRYGMLRRMKGWGKDPVGAVLCAVEFVGPCRFGGWARNGEPIAVPLHTTWVQTAAVSKEQTRNTMTLFPGLFSDRAIAEYGIDLGKEIIYADHGRCQIQSVTSSPRTLEGARSTFVLKNETHHWLANNEGHAMSEVIARNVAKVAARALAISNAHNPGEDSDAEHDYEAWQAIQSGKSRATRFLYDSIEAPPDVVLADRESLRGGLLAARGDSEWVDPDRLIEEIYDPRTPPSTSRRFYLNQIVAAEDAWVSPQDFDQLALAAMPIAGRQVTLGLDGSESDDHTALTGCDVETGHEFTIAIWNPEDYPDGKIPRDQVDAVVAQSFARWDVVGFYSDVHPFETYVDKWSVEYGDQLCVRATQAHPVAWDMRGRQKDSTKMAEELLDAIVESVNLLRDSENPRELLESGTLPLTHDADPDTNALARQHAHNARNRPNNYGMTFGKEHRSSSRKVDWLASAMLARRCRQDYLALPESKKRYVSAGWIVM